MYEAKTQQDFSALAGYDQTRNMVSYDISSRKNNRLQPTDTNEDFHYDTNADYNTMHFNCCGVSSISLPVSMPLLRKSQPFNFTISFTDGTTDPITINSDSYTSTDAIINSPGDFVKLINTLIGEQNFFLIDLPDPSLGGNDPSYDNFSKYSYTGKIHSKTNFNITFNQNSSLHAPIFGFDIGDGVLQSPNQVTVGGTTYYVAPFVPDIIPFSVVYLCSNEVSSKTSNNQGGGTVLASVFYNGAATYSYNYQDANPVANKKYLAPHKKIFRFYLLDEDFEPLGGDGGLQGIPFFFRFHMWQDENEN